MKPTEPSPVRFGWGGSDCWAVGWPNHPARQACNCTGFGLQPGRVAENCERTCRLVVNGCGSVLQRWPAEIGAGESERSKFRSLSRAARLPNLESCVMVDLAQKEADLQQFAERVKLVHKALVKVIAAIRRDANNSSDWLDGWQRDGLLLRDRLAEGPPTSGVILRELADANESELLRVDCLGLKGITAHQAILAVAEQIVMTLYECRRWDWQRGSEEARIAEITELRTRLAGVNVDDLGRRLDLKLSRMRPDGTAAMPPAEAGGQGGKASTPAAESEFVFRPDRDGYFIKGFGESGHVTAKGAKGLHDLFRLIQSPGIPVPMTTLGEPTGSVRSISDDEAKSQGLTMGRRTSRQPVADGMTFQQIAAKRTELKADIANADSDMEREELQSELDTLEDAAKGMKGLNGKPRDLNNPNDRLRPKIDGRIKTACKAMEGRFPNLSQHFANTCGAEGGFFVYTPGIPDMKWDTEPKQ